MLLPHVTVPYKDDWSATSISRVDPISFPHHINHCLSFARSEFDTNFEERPAVARRYIEDESFVADLKKMPAGRAVMMLRQVETMMITIVDYAGCVAWALAYFNERNKSIRRLISSFPENAKAPWSDRLMWRPPRRFPSAFAFDPKDALHQSFIASAAILKV